MAAAQAGDRAAYERSLKRLHTDKTSALKRTVERLIDFEGINDARDMCLSEGAVNVRTGPFCLFRR
jgi:hypothetical protein